MEKNKSVVCFGEILWDILPQGRRPGGAPMNVAYHLNRLGIKSTMISRVGDDAIGKELRDFLKGIGLGTEYIQCDPEYRTSEVIATIGKDEEVNYEIVSPVAWDFITYDSVFDRLLEESDMLVFGSLAARNEMTRNTLYQLLDKAKFKLFDVNFRDPHYTKETVDYLLRHSDAVKLNSNELQIIGEWLGNSTGKEQKSINLIQENYGMKEIIVTKGSQGVSYYTLTERYDYAAYKVEVNDTIGSGDSFLAAFISQKLKGEPIEDILDYAVALGAYITSHSGANPEYRLTDLNHFIWKKKLER